MNVYVFLFLFLLIEKYFGLIDLRGGLLVLIVVVLGYKQWRIKSLFSTYMDGLFFHVFKCYFVICLSGTNNFSVFFS